MFFHKTALPNVVELELEKHHDERGFFARSWCENEFQKNGLNWRLVQCNVSFNYRKGTLRGMHWQDAPHGEAKLIRCTSGSIFDVALDIRPDSPMFLKWHGAVLSAENRRMLYIPEGYAHGFLTLQDNTEIFYQMSEFYHPGSACGARFNDAAFGIVWPGSIEVISERDRTYPDFLA